MATIRKLAVAALAAIAVATVAGAAQAVEEGLTVQSGGRNSPLAATPPPRRQGRIVGGRTMTDLDPETGEQFLAKIFTPDGAGFYCGGSLVSRSHVLTRAGCNVFPGDVVRVGGAKLWDGLWYRVQKVTNHPAYNPAGDINDIAVLQLQPKSEAEMLRAGVVPVKMNQEFGNPHGFYVTGFGATDAAAATAGSLQLKRGYQPLRPWSKCREITNAVRLSDGSPLPVFEAAQVCTNYGSHWSGALCERDVGGGMFRADDVWVNGVRIKEYTLYAVSSYWIGTRTQICPQGYPNVGTKVAFYKDWIASAMR
ncbi:hypothetical protein MMPV_003947 [Pyropia vietnamensis]